MGSPLQAPVPKQLCTGASSARGSRPPGSTEGRCGTTTKCQIQLVLCPGTPSGQLPAQRASSCLQQLRGAQDEGCSPAEELPARSQQGTWPYVEAEVRDVRRHGHVVVTHSFVHILAVFHQHSLWPHALLCPPAEDKQRAFTSTRTAGDRGWGLRGVLLPSPFSQDNVQAVVVAFSTVASCGHL